MSKPCSMVDLLSDHRTPTCPHCGMAKLEIEDIIDTYTNNADNTFTEYSIGVCPNCEHIFSYNQIYTLEPTHYEDLEDVTEDEEDEEDDT